MKTLQYPILKDSIFSSPTFGSISFKELFRNLSGFVEEKPEERYNLVIGTDSLQLNDKTLFVSAIVIHRIGHGGRYYYKKIRYKSIKSLRQRIFYETFLSLEVAGLIRGQLSKNGLFRLPLEIHLDVSRNGDTREIIREVIGMVTGSGYLAVIKPDAYGATKVADRHSK